MRRRTGRAAKAEAIDRFEVDFGDATVERTACSSRSAALNFANEDREIGFKPAERELFVTNIRTGRVDRWHAMHGLRVVFGACLVMGGSS